MLNKSFSRPNFSKKNLGGFTLLEVMIAIFFITVGVLGVFTLIQQTITFAAISSSRLVAAYLGQEGIEIVRNIRDGNWLEQRTNPEISWNAGLAAGDWEADYNSQELTQSYGGNFLNLDTKGFYSYAPGTQTKFKRKITILAEGTETLKVSVLVEWSERARTYQFIVQENLYQWR